MRPTADNPIEIGEKKIGIEPQLCASIGDRRVEEVIKKINNVETDLIEIRIDKIDRDSYGELRRVLSETKTSEKPLIITNRREKEGGEYNGSESDRIKDLISFMQFADIVDIELNTPNEHRNKVISKAKEKGTPVIVSHHNFSLTTDTTEIASKIEECLELGDIAKVAYMARTPLDVLSLLRATYNLKTEFGKPICSISMGDTGGHSRIIAPFYGSDIVYAPAGDKTAPGQIPIEKTRSLLEEMV